MYNKEELENKICMILKNCIYQGRKIPNEYEKIELNCYHDLLNLLNRDINSDEYKKECEYNKSFYREILRDFRKYGISITSTELQIKRIENELKNYPNLIVKCNIKLCTKDLCPYNYYKTINNV